jgi:outer membrane receptor protein involved in Fe transport
MVTMIGSQAMILGKGPAHFMLNGRITDMGDEAIQQKLWTMRSEDIDRIEVLSIPSGRDAMEMGGGYINIVLRRDQTLGWRGDISMEAGSSDNWSGRANGSVSYVSEKFDMTIDAHGGRTTQTTDNLTNYLIEEKKNPISDTQTKQKNKELAANMVLHYMPMKNLELNGMLSWQKQWPETVIDGRINLPETDVFTRSKAEQNSNDNTIARSLTASCDWHIDTKGKLMSLTYSDYKKEDDGKSTVWSDYYHNWDTPDPDDVIYYAPLVMGKDLVCDVDYHIQSARFDLTLPFDFVTMDAGVSYTNIKNQGDMVGRIIDSDLIFVSNSTFDYKEKTKAAYLSLHHDWGKLAIKAALRYENIGWESEKDGINLLNADMETKDYWLPSFSLSFKPLEGHHVNLSWGTSTLRPNFYDLNPFRVYKSVWEYSEGNPLLRPSRISNIELGYLSRYGLYACAYHHHGSDMVVWVTNYLTNSREDEIHAMPYNDGRINQTGLYLRYQRQLSEHLMVTAEGDVYYHDATGSFEQPLYGWGKRMVISADWYLNSKHTLLLNGRYQHWFSDYRDMTVTDSYGYFYFALRYSLLDNRLKLSLVANDPFRQHITDETIYNSKEGWYGYENNMDMKQHLSHTNHHSHYIGLTATFSLGGKKVRHIHHDIENMETKRAEKQ